MIEPYGFTKEKQEVIDELIDEKVEDLVNDHVRFSSNHPKRPLLLIGDIPSTKILLETLGCTKSLPCASTAPLRFGLSPNLSPSRPITHTLL